MGSFFKGGPYEDIDFVVVLSCGIDELLDEARAVRAVLTAVGCGIGERFDIVIFTACEFLSAPLRDMATLTPIFLRT